MLRMVVDHFMKGRAINHEKIGCFAGVTGLFVGGLFNPIAAIIWFLLGGLLAGIAVEVYQRIIRWINNDPQNTMKESLLDIAVTALWPLFVFR